MATVLDRTVQALSDVSGFIVDRTVTPEKVIGQGWIISKSRMVVLASTISNYADAPWALLVKFPYPDLTFSVKAISLHPEFNKRAARDHYLSQSNELLPQPLVAENDIATITLDTEIPDLQPDRVQELTRALSLPLAISAQDLSGVMRAGETGNILQKALMSGRNGVLNLYDERKVPFCRILVRGGRILKAAFQNLQNEFAVCELMWRKPGGNFVLQSNDNLSWGGINEIQMATDQLANEANRRTQDLPRMLDALGGPNARYMRRQQQLDLNQINPQIRWVVEKVWPALDGGLPLSKMSERLAVDTYTAIQALWEMKHLGIVVQATTDQFHRSGQLGPALTPGHEVDLKFWDTLQAFYLDDLSNLPVMIQGNYFGSCHLLNLHTLLHTMPLPHCKYGAVVLKDGRLIGVHNGKFTANLQNPPPFPLSQMTWIGSLSEMSAKRMRTATTDIDSEGMDESLVASGRGTITGLKTRPSVTMPADLTPPPSEQAPGTVINEPAVLQKFSKVQILGAGGGMFLIGLLMALNSMLAPKPTVVATQPPPVSTTTTATDTGSQSEAPDPEAIKAGIKVASLRDKAIPPFSFTDTSKLTAPKKSVGLESEQANQKIMLVAWPNNDVKSSVDSNVKQPPFVMPLHQNNWTKQIDEGTSPVHNFYWKAWRYATKDEKPYVALVGAYNAQSEQAILVVATPFKDEGELDYKNTVNLIERMIIDTPSGEASAQTPASGEASAQEVQAYRQKTGDMIKSAYKAPSGSDRANKCVVNFVIDYTGNISKLELKYSSGMEDVDKAVQKAITSKLPFPPPPKTREGQIPMRVTVESDEMTIDEP